MPLPRLSQCYRPSLRLPTRRPQAVRAGRAVRRSPSPSCRLPSLPATAVLAKTPSVPSVTRRRHKPLKYVVSKSKLPLQGRRFVPDSSDNSHARNSSSQNLGGELVRSPRDVAWAATNEGWWSMLKQLALQWGRRRRLGLILGIAALAAPVAAVAAARIAVKVRSRMENQVAAAWRQALVQ